MKLLIIGTENNCRSQMAEGFIKYYADDIGFNIEVISAGTETPKLNFRAIKIMKEVGVDISNQTSNNIDQYIDSGFTHVFTVCDSVIEKCPDLLKTVKHIHQNFPDPTTKDGNEEEIKSAFRVTRELIDEYCCELVFELFSGSREAE